MDEQVKQVEPGPLPDSGQPEHQFFKSEPARMESPRSRGRRWLIIGGVIVLIVLVIIGIKNFSGNKEIEENSLANQESNNDLADYPDYAQLANMKKVELVNNFESWAPNSQLISKYLKNVVVKESGQISRGYVYVKAAVGDKAFTKFDSFYLKFNQSGGHLFRPASLAVPASGITELLYPLENVSYLPSIPYDESRTPQIANWQNLFGDNKNIKIFTFISSRKSAKILELAIYYDCQDESECLLSVQ